MSAARARRACARAARRELRSGSVFRCDARSHPKPAQPSGSWPLMNVTSRPVGSRTRSVRNRIGIWSSMTRTVSRAAAGPVISSSCSSGRVQNSRPSPRAPNVALRSPSSRCRSSALELMWRWNRVHCVRGIGQPSSARSSKPPSTRRTWRTTGGCVSQPGVLALGARERRSASVAARRENSHTQCWSPCASSHF